MLRRKWTVSQKVDYLIGYYLDEAKTNFWEVARVPEWRDKEERRRYTNLIAAAPDLLEALCTLVETSEIRPEDMQAARAAIAKAEGEEVSDAT